MKCVVPVLMAALLSAAPVLAHADPGDRRGWSNARAGDGGGRGWRDRGGDRDRGRYDDGGGRSRDRYDDRGSRGWRDRRDDDADYAEPSRQGSRGWGQEQNDARARVRSGEFRPLGTVIGELRRRTPGRQLDTAIEQGRDGRPVYRVRWAADNGRRIDYTIDARTGAILSAEGQ